MADRRSAEVSSAMTAVDAGAGAAGPGERRGSGTVGIYERPAWWKTKKGAIMIAAVSASSLLTLFFYLAAS